MNKFNLTLHKELWNRLTNIKIYGNCKEHSKIKQQAYYGVINSHREKDMSDYRDAGEFNYCLACKYDNEHPDCSLKNLCKNCPLEMDICYSKDSIYKKWRESVKAKRYSMAIKFAKQLRDMKVKKGINVE